jgi:acetyl esterase/lipase
VTDTPVLSQAMISGSIISHILPANMPQTPETRRLLSPLHLLSSSACWPYPPTFLAIPQLDTLVPPSQSWRFAERIKEIGGEVVCKRADGAGHAFDLSGGERNEGGGDWYEEVVRPGLDFLAEKLGM